MKTSWWSHVLGWRDAFRAHTRDSQLHESVPPSPCDLSQSMDSIVTRMLAKGEKHRGNSKYRFQHEHTVDDYTKLRRDLMQLEKSSVTAPEPLQFLRAALLDYTEAYKVEQLVDDQQFRNTTEDERQDGVAMKALLAQRLEYPTTPSAYWVCGRTVKALARYLDLNYPDCFSSPWWEAYVSNIFDRVDWLSRLVHSLRVMGIAVPGERTILPDDMILNHWEAWSRENRTRALTCPDEFAYSRRNDILMVHGIDRDWDFD